jgi:hypothetical protein
MAKKENEYFIQITNPRETRKSLLENTRDVLKILKGYEDFRKVRAQRSELIGTYKTQMNEVKSLVSGLRKLLPKTKGMKKAVVPRMIPVPEAAEKPGIELKKLEDELAEIESKLSEL